MDERGTKHAKLFPPRRQTAVFRAGGYSRCLHLRDRRLRGDPVRVLMAGTRRCRPLLVASLGMALGAVLGLSGCGRSESDSARNAAIGFAQASLAGDGVDACAMLTQASRAANDAQLAVLYDARYTQDTTRASCVGRFDTAATDTFSQGVIPQLPAPSAVSVSGAHATVTFEGNYGFMFTGPQLNQVELVKTNGSWRVVYGSASSREAAIQDADAPPDAIAAWNQAIQLGAVQPPVLAGWGSQQIWAYITPGAPHLMSVDTPDASESYIEQPDGSWVSWPAPNPPQQGTLNRDVWLDSDGIATPASDPPPDGTMSGLNGAPPPQSSVSSPTTTTTVAPPATGGAGADASAGSSGSSSSTPTVSSATSSSNSPDVCPSVTRRQASVTQANGEEIHIQALSGVSCQEATEVGFNVFVRYIRGPVSPTNYPRSNPGGFGSTGQGVPLQISAPSGAFACSLINRGSDFLFARCTRGAAVVVVSDERAY
jgi:hypothetical protein